MSVTSKNKYPEEERCLFNYDRIMLDDKFILLQQCIRDGRELVKMLYQFSGREDYYVGLHGEKGAYATIVMEIATLLFNERRDTPVNFDTMKTLINTVEASKQEIEETASIVETLGSLMQQKNELEKEIAENRDVLTQLRSKNFLKQTIGHVKYDEFMRTGCIQIKAKNGVYHIYKDGTVQKIKQDSFFSADGYQWSGRISNPGNLPINDAIAIVYTHIIADSDKFDRDKACGQITILS